MAPCRWILSADLVIATHSSHLTRSPLQYTGLDIQPGMWVFANSEAKALRVMSIINATDASIECVVEDVDRYNTFTDPTQGGVGIFSPTSALIFFELGDDGLPILNPLPANTDISTVSQVEARFRVFNPVVENRFFQINHGFKEGQVLRLDSNTGLFVHANSNDLYVVGTVTAVGPGPNYFYLAPSTKVITNLEPGLPGSVGDVIWLDPLTGDRTIEQTGSIAPLYIKMTAEVPCFTIGGTDNPTTWDTTAIKLNNQLITFSDPGGPVDTNAIISTINGFTTNTGVTASLGSPKNTVVGTAMYPMTTPTTELKFSVNGVETTASLPSVNFGTAGQLGWWDVIRSINEQTFKHNVYASFDTNTGFVTLTSDAGDAIDIVNIAPSTTSGEEKTLTDMLGIPSNSPAADATRLKLTRSDGGQITITDVSGSFSYDTGIRSAANGVLPLGLVVDKTMNTNSNYVVADIAARDALTNLRTGDQVFVQAAEDGEWALFVLTGETWTKIADADSAKVDADTLELTITPESGPSAVIGSISGDSRITDITVRVDEVFDSPTATIEVRAGATVLMSGSVSDLTVVGAYEADSSFTYEGVTEQEITVYFTADGATTGSATVLVSYV